MSVKSNYKNAYTKSPSGLLPGISRVDVTPRSVKIAHFGSGTYTTQGEGFETVNYDKPSSPYDSFCLEKLEERIFREIIVEKRKSETAALKASLPPIPEKQRSKPTRIATATRSNTAVPQTHTGKIASPFSGKTGSFVGLKPKRAGFYRPAPSLLAIAIPEPRRDLTVTPLSPTWEEASPEIQKMRETVLLAHLTPRQLEERRARLELFKKINDSTYS